MYVVFDRMKELLESNNPPAYKLEESKDGTYELDAGGMHSLRCQFDRNGKLHGMSSWIDILEYYWHGSKVDSMVYDALKFSAKIIGCSEKNWHKNSEELTAQKIFEVNNIDRSYKFNK